MFFLLIAGLQIISSLSPTCLVFYTGGNNMISPNIYSNFLNGFNNVDIYKLPNKYKKDEITEIYKELNKNYNNIVVAGHSSGCVKAIDNCNTAVNKLVLLDPVKTPFWNNRNNLNYLENILVINADKSYKWSKIPPFIPFIPLFRLKFQDINIDKSKIKEITIKNYGHCDIINNPYRNLMHYSRISLGHPRRKKQFILAYHKLLHKLIGDFIKPPDKQLESAYIKQDFPTHYQ